MSRKYKFHNKEELYFISFAVVYWIDVFVRDCYFDIIMKSLDYGRKNKGMEFYVYCVMTRHVHTILRAASGNPSDLLDLLGDFKTYTSKRLQEEIVNNHQESRREWMVWMMERSGEKNSNVKNRQFWQQQNKPIEWWPSEVMDQKLDYIIKTR